jgi:hypothetical protein
MKPKHTPGPWRHEGTFDSVVRGADNSYVAVSSGYQKGGWVSLTQANARLIAAAPEMLEALIEAYKINNHWGANNYHKWSDSFEETVVKIIERATGLSIEEVVEATE